MGGASQGAERTGPACLRMLMLTLLPELELLLRLGFVARGISLQVTLLDRSGRACEALHGSWKLGGLR